VAEVTQTTVRIAGVITEVTTMSMNKYGGVNDMPDGFTKTPLGKRVYSLWFGILRRCYDYQQHQRKRGKTYSNVIVCDRWFYLKNFYEDIQKLDGYSEWLEKDTMSLDKDIYAQEITKIYSPSTCKFVTIKENIQEMNDRCDTVKYAKEANKTVYVIFKGDEYHVFDSEKDACEFLGVKKCSVAGAWRDKGKCRGWNVVRVGNCADMREEEK
jgi:hypothetical protein